MDTLEIHWKYIGNTKWTLNKIASKSFYVFLSDFRAHRYQSIRDIEAYELIYETLLTKNNNQLNGKN